MKSREFKAKAENLLQQYNEEYPNRYSDGWGEEDKLGDILDEFLHLVFFFNPDIPMLKEMQEERGYTTRYKENPKKYMERFIHYIDEFCDTTEVSEP